MTILEHQIGDLVMHNGTLGYIKTKTIMDKKRAVLTALYTVYWFNPRCDDDESNEWCSDIMAFKRELDEYQFFQS